MTKKKVKTNIGFEVLTAVVMNVAIFWDISPCSPYVCDLTCWRNITFIFKVKNQPSKEPACSRCLAMLVSCLADFLPWRWEVIRSSEILVHIQTTWRYIQEDSNVQLKTKTILSLSS
jgi:hypothetical protein